MPGHLRRRAGPDKRDYRVDFTKIRAPARFQPTWTVADGIDELAGDMRRFGLSAEDFEGPRYVRLARIRSSWRPGGSTTSCACTTTSR